MIFVQQSHDQEYFYTYKLPWRENMDQHIISTSLYISIAQGDATWFVQKRGDSSMWGFVHDSIHNVSHTGTLFVSFRKLWYPSTLCSHKMTQESTQKGNITTNNMDLMNTIVSKDYNV